MSTYNQKLHELMRDSLMASLLAAFQDQYGRQPTEDDFDLLLVMKKRFPQKLYRPREWLEDLERVCAGLLSGQTAPSDYGLFWIRLYEAIDAIPKHYVEQRQMLAKMGADGIASQQTFVTALNLLVSTLGQGRNSFTEQETLLIDFMRQGHAHIFQNGFDVKTRENGGRREIFAEYKKTAVVEIFTFIEQESHRYGGDVGVAKAYAMKYSASLKAILSTMNIYLTVS